MIPPSRVLLAGGPYDGYEWWPLAGRAFSQWAAESPTALSFDHTRPDAPPSSGEFLSECELLVKGPCGDELYLLAWDDLWQHARFWEFDPVPDLEPDLDPSSTLS